MLIVFEWIRTAAKSDIAVLILGPTGSGKEVVARMIHELSRRGTERFQASTARRCPTRCSNRKSSGSKKARSRAHTIESRTTGARRHGTLFLDEIGDLSLVAQAKLLRVLEDRRFERLGGQKSLQVDFRLISATNRPLDQFVRDARFREDLYYRVNAFSIRLPSLRERPVDIPVLANRFLARYCAGNGLPLDGKTLSPEAMTRLQSYPWPGNIRELESTVSRAALSAPGRVIRDSDIEFCTPAFPCLSPRAPALPTLRDAERAHYRPGARRGVVEQEGSGPRTRDQPRHAVSEDRRVQPGAGDAHVPNRTPSNTRCSDTAQKRSSPGFSRRPVESQ
jgi:DNA-binding NtrC family response regulator